MRFLEQALGAGVMLLVISDVFLTVLLRRADLHGIARAKLLRIEHLSVDEPFLRRSATGRGVGPDGQFESVYTGISTIASEMANIKKSHHFYPVLFYFRFRDPFRRMPSFVTGKA